MIYNILSNKYIFTFLTLIWICCILVLIIQLPDNIENIIDHLYGVFAIYICFWCLFMLYVINKYRHEPEEYNNVNYLRL